MNRRQFLVGTAGAAALAGLDRTGWAQGRQGAGPGRGGRGRGRGPADVPAEKLARLSIMTLDFSNMLKFPWDADPAPDRTLDIRDLPQMYRDTYGVDHVEFQHSHLVSGRETPPDPAFFSEMKAKLDAAKMTASQVNIEIGTIPGLAGEAREAWMSLGKQWVDAAPIIGVKRLMLNQSGLNEENKANTISVWKELQDYAKPKGIMISAETRGGGATSWVLLAEVIRAAGGYSNVDIGNVGAANQQELHDAIKGLYPTSSGNMHIKSSPNWDIGDAVRFTESLGYTGLYSIEVRTHEAVRIVYNTILANLA